MKVVLLLSWYDESPSWLSAVVSGFGRVCDEVVAVDGAYLFYPDAKPRSHPEQAEAVLHAAEAAGSGCTIHRPLEPFEQNEVGKRNFMLRLVGALDADWLIVADGDHHLTWCDPLTVRGLLEQTDLNVAQYLLTDQQDPFETVALARSAAEVEFLTCWDDPLRAIYRWTPDLAYGPSHETVTGTYDGRHQILRGYGQEAALDLRGSLVAVHRTRARPKIRREAAKRYYRVRDETGIEAAK